MLRNQQSRPIHISNWFVNRDLALQIQEKATGMSEYWTGLFLQFEPNSKMPPEIQQFNSPSRISIYDPMWNEIQPQINGTFKEPTKICISFNVNLAASSNYGWKLRSCDDEFPVICETFGCIHGLFII
jgi:hypothetical protein